MEPEKALMNNRLLPAARLVIQEYTSTDISEEQLRDKVRDLLYGRKSFKAIYEEGIITEREFFDAMVAHLISFALTFEPCVHPVDQTVISKASQVALEHGLLGRRMKRVLGLNLMVLRSANPDRAIKFYSSLGMVFGEEQHGKGPKHHSCSANGTTLEIYLATEKHPPSSSVRLGFVVSSLDLCVTALHAISVEPSIAPKVSEWGYRAVFVDFDGNKVELVEHLE